MHKIKTMFTRLGDKLKKRAVYQKANYGRVGGSQPIKLKKPR